MGKTPIVVKDRPGFLVNRLLLPYLNEAAYLLEEGYPISFVDQVFVNFGMPMGPLRLLDEIGIDVADKVSKIFHQNFGERARPCVLMSRLVQSSYYGKKNQKGFYLYDDKFKEIGENKSLYTEFKTKTLPDHLLETAEQDVLDRGLYTMINEAARLLSEQVVSNPEDVDLGMIMGTGFPPFRGGLLRFADEVGFSQIIAKLEQLQKLHGSRFVCTPALKEKTSFYSKKH